VLTRRPEAFADARAIATTLADLDARIKGLGRPVFVIGGAAVYDLLWDRIDEFLVSRVNDEVDDGDTFFPRALEPEFGLASTETLSESCVVERWARGA
jgi:dihydrofolate reductase